MFWQAQVRRPNFGRTTIHWRLPVPFSHPGMSQNTRNTLDAPTSRWFRDCNPHGNDTQATLPFFQAQVRPHFTSNDEHLNNAN